MLHQRSQPLRIRLDGKVHQEHFRIAYAEPQYTPAAQKRGIEGTVLLDALIGIDGAIRDLSVNTGEPLMVDAALETVRHWAYRPTKLNGVPVEVVTQIEVNFTLPTD
jgi:TonB family protein